uniref:Transposase n=1 Tax=Globodera rostochiensis TaxID=31243 RepID=A0A914HDF9_GLORO
MGETISKPVKWIGNKLYKLGEDVLFPPISYVLAMNGRPDLMDSLNNGLKYKKTEAIIHIVEMLSDLGLDHIVIAFKKAVEEKMVCRRCGKEIKFIDELCYCPEDSGEKCHHGTSCCDNRKIKAVTSGR